MSYSFHWRKAIATSFFLHIFLLMGAGYLTIGLTVPLPLQEEVILEMDLVNDPAQRTENNLASLESPSLQAMPNSTLTEAPPSAEALPIEQEAVVTTNGLTMMEAEGAPVKNSTSVQPSTTSGSLSPSSKTSGEGNDFPRSIVAPGILSKTTPTYSLQARQRGLEGTVVLKVQILTNGRPGEITVFRSTGHQTLDDAAVAAVEKWRFAPAKDRNTGRPVACYTTLPVSFHLKDH